MEQLLLPLLHDVDGIVVVKGHEVRDAWDWLLANMSLRPSQCSELCVYDLKVWGDADVKQPLLPVDTVGMMLGRLYLTSELGDLEAIIKMVNGLDAENVVVPDATLDEDVKNVVKSQRRFRDGLSEHLAFWVCLATAAQSSEDAASRFACILPHVQPEDKGPDGLFLSVGPTTKVELQSVKNSAKDPLGSLSTKSFREKGLVSSNPRRRLLEEFYGFAHQRFGFTRLKQKLSDLCMYLDVPAHQKIRIALLSSTLCSYNAVVVADHQYASPDLFNGYQYVTHDTEHRIATYIASTNWVSVAETIRKSVVQILAQSGCH